MPIVSISLSDDILNELDQLQRAMGFSGRSDTIRTAILDFIQSQKTLSELSGIVEGVVIAVHDESDDDNLSRIWHTHKHLIKSHIHNHLDSHKCLEIFTIKGKAEHAKALMEALQTSRKIEYSKIFVS